MSQSPGLSGRKRSDLNAGSRPESGKSGSLRDEVESNSKNIRGYQKKGLLDVIERETTHYTSNNKVPTKPPTPQQNKRGKNVGAIQNSSITEDTLAESKRMTVTNRKVGSATLSGGSVNRGRSQGPPQSNSPYPVKPVDLDKVGIKAFSSVNEIQRYLENPQLINQKAMPSKLLD
jgi:hypothetical protein